MLGYQCGPQQIEVDQDGIFKVEYTHLRNNIPYSVELKLTSMDEAYSEVKKDLVIGGVLRAPFTYVEIPMSSTSNLKASSEIMTY